MLCSLLSTTFAYPPSTLVLQASDSTAANSTEAFLSSRLRFTHDINGQEICLLDLNNGEEIGVMMGWEREISEHS